MSLFLEEHCTIKTDFIKYYLLPNSTSSKLLQKIKFHIYIYIYIYIEREREREKQTRHAGHGWRSRDELISDVLLWTPSHGRAKAGWPAQTYIQQLCADMGCSSEDLPEAMDDREGWRERVKDSCADGTTWWWYIYIYIYMRGVLIFEVLHSHISGYKVSMQFGNK